jgi:hypothetical protein
MIARGCKVCVSSLIAIICKEGINLGVPYSTPNTLLDTSTIIARGYKLYVSSLIVSSCKVCWLGCSHFGYSTPNTLLDSSTMIARGCMVCVSTKVAINCMKCTKAVFWAFPLATLQPIPAKYHFCQLDIHIKASSVCSYWLQHLLPGVQGMYNSAGSGRKPPKHHCQYQQRVQGSHLLGGPIGQVYFSLFWPWDAIMQGTYSRPGT